MRKKAIGEKERENRRQGARRKQLATPCLYCVVAVAFTIRARWVFFISPIYVFSPAYLLLYTIFLGNPPILCCCCYFCLPLPFHRSAFGYPCCIAGRPELGCGARAAIDLVVIWMTTDFKPEGLRCRAIIYIRRCMHLGSHTHPPLFFCERIF